MDKNGKSTKRLPQTIATALLFGRHARGGGRTPRERAGNLTLIAASYSRDEILGERGSGPQVPIASSSGCRRKDSHSANPAITIHFDITY
ncbi:hypothetical protein [Ancylobacter polymorphus]|uniref:Uncharacterized protein n=1 Tax=Ancylobacter polymorphus TaxID=223390 RepID=A0A9E7CY94_9HYPH|nr:hypothetical protein [Ancylobacter polymorphus]UOK73284.1 hypothetical protein K9D25_21790 [Ancylobacter polymorphus]